METQQQPVWEYGEVHRALERLGFTDIQFDRNTETGDYYRTAQGIVCINHDTSFIFLNGEPTNSILPKV